jgi:hypothetical protein
MSDIAQKWGVNVAQRGFAQIPNYLLLLNQFLDEDRRLSPVELLVLLQLVGSWWVKDTMPFPSMKTLAVRCGVSDRQIQRAVNKLEKVGLVARVNRRNKGIIASNAYDLAPLVSLLGDVAKVFPNEFPRNVDKAKVQAISARLSPPSEKPEDSMGSDKEEVVINFSDRLLPGVPNSKAQMIPTLVNGKNVHCLIDDRVIVDIFGGKIPQNEMARLKHGFRRMIEAKAYEPQPEGAPVSRVRLTVDNFDQWVGDA